MSEHIAENDQVAAHHFVAAQRSVPVGNSFFCRLTCACGEVIDAHPDVAAEAFEFHTAQYQDAPPTEGQSTLDLMALAWDEGHSATDEHGPGECECPNPYRAVSPGDAERETQA